MTIQQVVGQDAFDAFVGLMCRSKMGWFVNRAGEYVVQIFVVPDVEDPGGGVPSLVRYGSVLAVVRKYEALGWRVTLPFGARLPIVGRFFFGEVGVIEMIPPGGLPPAKDGRAYGYVR